MTTGEAAEALMVVVATFPESERRAALIGVIELWEKVHVERRTPMPFLFHLLRHHLRSRGETQCSGASYPVFHRKSA